MPISRHKFNGNTSTKRKLVNKQTKHYPRNVRRNQFKIYNQNSRRKKVREWREKYMQMSAQEFSKSNTLKVNL